MKQDRSENKNRPLQPLTDSDMELVSGGTGYTSIKCKRCGMSFTDLDQFRTHVLLGCSKK